MSAQIEVLKVDEALDLGQALLAHLGEENGIRLLVIKGRLAARQGLRTDRIPYDIDVLIEPTRGTDLEEALIERGWYRRVEEGAPIGVLPWHSRTMASERWPADIDAHTRFPGFLKAPAEVFELLWERREIHELAHRPVPCIDRHAHALLLGLHSIRSTQSEEAGDLREVEQVALGWSESERQELRRVADLTGAAWPLRAFFVRLGQPEPPRPATTVELESWELLVGAPPGAAWVLELRRTPWHRLPARLWRAVWLTEDNLRGTYPETPPGWRAITRVRLRRIRQSAPRAFAAVRATRGGRIGGGS